MSVFEPKLITIAREQDLRCFGECVFCSLFYIFEIKKGLEGGLHEGGRKQSRDWITGELRFCALLKVVRLISKVC